MRLQLSATASPRISRDRLYKCCLVVVAVLFALLAVEAALWLSAPIETDSYVYSVMQSIPGTKPVVALKSYRYGMRARAAPARRKPTRTIRILCLGGSTTEALSQSSDDAWWGILEKMLTPQLAGQDVDIEILAVGKSGFTVFEDLQWTVHHLREIDPDIVVTLLGINNLAWKGGPSYAYSAQDQTRRLATAEAGSWRDTLEQRSQLVRRIIRVKRLFAQWRNLRTGRAIDWHDIEAARREYRGLAFVAQPIRKPDPLVEFENDVGLLLEYLRQARIKEVIVLGQPVLWTEHPSSDDLDHYWFSIGTPAGRVRAAPQWLAREMHRYNETQRRIADRFDFTYLDLALSVPPTTAAFFDDCHFTDEGNRIVAEAVFPTMVDAIRRTVLRLKPAAQ